jgi:hypothetical protein
MESNIEIYKKTQDIIYNELVPIINSIGEEIEGNIILDVYTMKCYDTSSQFYNKINNIITTAKQSNVKNGLEIGFNCGCSALLLLLSNPDLCLTCIDICIHKYTIPCYQKLKELFGNRINLLNGSSNDIMPHLIENTYDFIHIDGSHDYNIANNDILYSIKVAKNNAILIMDDTNQETLKYLWSQYKLKYSMIEPPFELTQIIEHDIKILKK